MTESADDLRERLRLRQMQLMLQQRAQAQAQPQSEAQRLQALPVDERIGAVLERGEAGRDPDMVARQEAIDARAAQEAGLFQPRDVRAEAAESYQPGRLAAGIHNAAQGATVGLSDELMGVVGGARALFDPSQTMREGYEESRDRARGMLDASRRDYPGTSLAAEIGGAVALPIPGAQARAVGGGVQALPSALRVVGNAAARFMGSGSLGARIGRGALAGGTFSGLYGFNTGEGGLEDRLDNARDVGAMGAVVGGAMPPVVDVARAGVNAAAQPVRNIADRVLNRGSESRASRALARTLRESGQSVDDVERALRQAADEGQDVFRLADALGTPGQRQLSGLVRSGGEGSTEATRLLTQRQLDQPDRMSRFVAEAFDATETAAQRKARLTAARGQAADAAYDAARGNAAPVDVRKAVSVIDDRIGGMQGSGVAGDSIDAALARFKARLTAADPAKARTGSTAAAVGDPGPASRVDLSDFNRVLGVKQDVSDAIEAARRAGQNNRARELSKLARALDEALEAASPSYRAANDGFRAASRVIDAVDEGAGFVPATRRAEDTLDAFRAMTPEQQAAARAGYGDRLLSRIEGAGSEGTNRAAPFSRTKAQREAAEMALDPDLFARRVGRENTMHRTQTTALGGSRTADNISDVSRATDEATGALAKLVRGNIPGAVWDGLVSGARGAFGESPQTRDLIVEALMAGNVDALRRGAGREAITQGLQEIVELLARRSTAALSSQ